MQKLMTASGMLKQLSQNLNWTHLVVAFEAGAFLFFAFKIYHSAKDLKKINQKKKKYQSPLAAPNMRLTYTVVEDEWSIPQNNRNDKVSDIFGNNSIHNLDLLFEVATRPVEQIVCDAITKTFAALLTEQQRNQVRNIYLDFNNTSDFLNKIESKVTWVSDHSSKMLIVANLGGEKASFFQFLSDPETKLEQMIENEIFWGVDVTSSAELSVKFATVGESVLQKKMNEVLKKYTHVLIIDKPHDETTIASALGLFRQDLALDHSSSNFEVSDSREF